MLATYLELHFAAKGEGYVFLDKAEDPIGNIRPAPLSVVASGRVKPHHGRVVLLCQRRIEMRNNIFGEYRLPPGLRALNNCSAKAGCIACGI